MVLEHSDESTPYLAVARIGVSGYVDRPQQAGTDSKVFQNIYSSTIYMERTTERTTSLRLRQFWDQICDPRPEFVCVNIIHRNRISLDIPGD